MKSRSDTTGARWIPSRPDDPKDEQRFAYPVYVVFLMAPTIGLSFPAAQTCFRWLFVLLTLVSVPLWLRAVRWRPSARSHSRFS